jgi:hypothetical protein
MPMVEGSDASTPGRGNIARRITRFLGGLERARRQPNRREAYHLRDALERMEAQDYSQSEDAVLRAEHSAPLPGHVANLLTTNESVTVRQLRDELDRILKTP